MFSKSKNYEGLKYLESTGTQFIDTDIVVMPEIECDCEYILLQQNRIYPRLFGSQNLGNSTGGAFIVSLERSVATFAFRGLENEATLFSAVGYVVGHHYRIRCYGGGFEIWDLDGGGHDKISGATGFCDMPPLSLFSSRVRQVSDHDQCHAVARISLFKVSYNGVVAHHLVPVRRVGDGILGMYDTITKTFYRSIGTGSFMPGPATGRYYD